MLDTYPNSNAHDVGLTSENNLDRQAFLILGMHRSGTSALTRVVNLLGPTAAATIMEPGPDNIRGYWESGPVVQFHDRLLAELKSGWSDWRAIDAEWQASDRSLSCRTGLRQLIEDEFGKSSIFVSKDPRACRLAPLWLNTLSSMRVEPVILLAVRAPSEVAASLAKRNGFPMQLSLALGLRHTLDAERATRGLRRAVVCYEALLADWRAEMARVASVIGVDWPRSMEDAARDVDEFLSAELRHHAASAEDMAEVRRVAPWAANAYEALLALWRSPESETALRELDDISAQFEQATSMFDSVVNWERERLDVELRRQAAEERERLEAEWEHRLAEERERLDAEWRRRLAEERERQDAEWRRRLAKEREELEAELHGQLAEGRAAWERSLTMERAAREAVESVLTRTRKRPMGNLWRFIRWQANKNALKLAPLLPRRFAQIAERETRKNSPK